MKRFSSVWIARQLSFLVVRFPAGRFGWTNPSPESAEDLTDIGAG
jgi:hypothetical protein